jgi:uncharacterized protein YecE (DUF72 family)
MTKKNQKNKNQNWHKKIKKKFDWSVKLNRKITLTKWKKKRGPNW